MCRESYLTIVRLTWTVSLSRQSSSSFLDDSASRCLLQVYPTNKQQTNSGGESDFFLSKGLKTFASLSNFLEVGSPLGPFGLKTFSHRNVTQHFNLTYLILLRVFVFRKNNLNLLNNLVYVGLGGLKTRLLELRNCNCDLMKKGSLMCFYKAIRRTFRHT